MCSKPPLLIDDGAELNLAVGRAAGPVFILPEHLPVCLDLPNHLITAILHFAKIHTE